MSTKTNPLRRAAQTWPGLERVDLALEVWETTIPRLEIQEACSGCAWTELFKPALVAVTGRAFDSKTTGEIRRAVIDRLQVADPAGGHGIDPALWDQAAAILPVPGYRQGYHRRRLQARLDLLPEARPVVVRRASDWEPVDLSRYLTDDAEEAGR
ncbi:hypothetical protein C3V38_14485 [Dietzia sp. oral taxon 368]|uniref:hypothetical protein n=1 Tax=Dietzia sp. oral taxon 368 TaxID=712270 RepID=UPI000D08AD21|nr:hypothetical protein [Dietzia sp. oral taxon 368]AVM65398.1 hypothetical protein C3V38_14485 [Dietzia sp. oral taxon 368]